MKTKLKKVTLLLISWLAIARIPALAQIPQIDMDDAFDELEGHLNLYFFNALDGKPIPNGSVGIATVGEYQTDYEGKISFAIPAKDTLYQVAFRMEGFIDSEFKIEIVANTIFFNRFSVSPKMEFGALRVVLDWDAVPVIWTQILSEKSLSHFLSPDADFR
jgi:hypothetical protein